MSEARKSERALLLFRALHVSFLACAPLTRSLFYSSACYTFCKSPITEASFKRFHFSLTVNHFTIRYFFGSPSFFLLQTFAVELETDIKKNVVHVRTRCLYKQRLNEYKRYYDFLRRETCLVYSLYAL